MFENWQWKVTEYGLEAKKGTAGSGMNGRTPEYEIPAQRLVEPTERNGKLLYDWPIHMAEKTWVSVDAFVEAFCHALKEHAGKYPKPVDAVLLYDSFIRAQTDGANR